MNSKQINSQNVDYIYSEIQTIIEKYGERDPGSVGEIKTLEHMSGELKKYADSDSINIQYFDVAPKAVWRWTYITAISFLLAVFSYFFLPILTVFFVVTPLLLVFFQTFLYKPVLDVFLLKRKSANLYASLKPKGEIKKRLVINSHVDAPFEWTHNYIGGYKMLLSFSLLAFLGAIYFLFLSIVNMIATKNMTTRLVNVNNPLMILGLVGVLFVPFIISLVFFINPRVVSPGATSSLTSCYLSIAAMKTIAETNIPLLNTELAVLINGSKEAGLRGAKSWLKTNPDFAQGPETIVITYDAISRLDQLTIYKKDLNGVVKNDLQIAELYSNIAKKNDVKLNYDDSIRLGATNAAAYTQSGIKSCSIRATSKQFPKYYHTRLDNHHNVSKECLEAMLQLTVDLAYEYDKNGLPKVESN